VGSEISGTSLWDQRLCSKPLKAWQRNPASIGAAYFFDGMEKFYRMLFGVLVSEQG